MRLSLVGSTGWFGSTYSSRLPLPLVSRMRAVHPCDGTYTVKKIFVIIAALVALTTVASAQSREVDPNCSSKPNVEPFILRSSNKLEVWSRTLIPIRRVSDSSGIPESLAK
jgi:hypothetical protein